MRIKTLLTMYRNFIILIWWMIIIVVFKIITNFKFHNGLSILFVGLLVIPPLALYIFTSIHKRSLIRKKKARGKTYFSRIKRDFQNKNMERVFIHTLTATYGHVELIYNEEKIEIKHDYFSIVFLPNKAILSIHNTRVIYQYYYTHKYDGFSVYDKRYLQYHDLSYLYTVILTKINTLFAAPLIYFEGPRCCMLSSSDESTIYYKKNSHRNKKEKYQSKVIIEMEKVTTSKV